MLTLVRSIFRTLIRAIAPGVVARGVVTRGVVTPGVVALMLCAPAFAATPAVDVFGRPAVSASPASSADAASSPAPDVAATAKAPTFALPEPVREVLAAGIVWQGELNARIEDAASELRRDATPRVWLTLLLMSFAYGVLHAIGPGHGKLIVGTYLGSRNARVAQAVMLSGWTATVQALSAIALVVGAAWLARTGVESVLSQAESLEIVSYALLCVAGGWTLWTTLTRRDCCFDPSAIELVPKARNAALSPDARDARHARDTLAGDAAYLGAKLSQRPREQRRSRGLTGFAPVAASGASSLSQLAATGFAAGVRPCVGAIFVLVASVAARVPSVGIAATFAMAAGVAVTVTLVGLGSVGMNRLLVTRTLRYRSRVKTAQRAVAIAGAVVIVLFAAAQIALLLGGYVEPSLS